MLQQKGPPKVVSTSRKITMAEVEAHNTKESCWFVRDGKVWLLICTTYTRQWRSCQWHSIRVQAQQ
jgi:hypothetical protein